MEFSGDLAVGFAVAVQVMDFQGCSVLVSPCILEMCLLSCRGFSTCSFMT